MDETWFPETRGALALAEAEWALMARLLSRRGRASER
jgi:hypothetical protein